jgi:hypothetical protein
VVCNQLSGSTVVFSPIFRQVECLSEETEKKESSPSPVFFFILKIAKHICQRNREKT